MSYETCLETIKNAAGRDLSDEEMHDLLTALTRREAYLKAMDPTLTDAALRAADEITNNMKMAAVIEKRNAALNMVKRTERVLWVQKNFGNNLAEGLESILVGVNRAKEGARDSVSAAQTMLSMSYMQGMKADLESARLFKLFKSGAMDQDVARALWAVGKANEADLTRSLPREAVDLAKIIHKWQEVARTDANLHGAWIGKMDGYIVRQTHDAERIRGDGTEAAFQRWKAATLPLLDQQRMLAQSGSDSIDNMLRNVWTDLASGNHQHLGLEDMDKMSGFKGPSNIAKKASESRTIHFKDADSWTTYNNLYGSGSLMQSVVGGLEMSAKRTGIMSRLGTNPGAMFETIKADLIADAKAAGKVDLIAKLDGKRERLAHDLAAVDGSMNAPGNLTAARLGSNLRSWQTMAHLGGMLLSQLNDIAVFAAGTHYQGRGFLSGMSEAVGGLGRGLAAPERQKLAASLGVALDNMRGELARVGDFSQPGMMSRAAATFMDYTGGNWWVSRMRASAAFGMSSHMAEQAGKAWGALDHEYQRVFSLYGIGEKEWDSIRSSNLHAQDGARYILPENVTDKEAARKLQTYLSDQTLFLALEPDARTRAFMTQGTRPGTWSGEMARFLGQFKSFTGAYMQKIVGRELFGRGYEGDSVVGALKNGEGEIGSLTQLMVATTLLGYASMALKDLAKGQTPKDPTQSPAMAAKVFLAAMVQGGGAGIYGDFLFGQASRAGGGTLETLAGPTLGAGARVVDLYHRALAGDDVKASALREVVNQTPFVNLFYTRLAMDYLFMWNLQDHLNPGYVRRMQQNAQKQYGQTFWLQPRGTQ